MQIEEKNKTKRTKKSTIGNVSANGTKKKAAKKVAKKSKAVQTGVKDFDWDSLERGGTIIKGGDGSTIKIFSKEPYAKKLLKLYERNLKGMPLDEVSEKDIVHGRVVRMDECFAQIEFGYKEPVFIDLNKEEERYRNDIRVGNDISVIIKKKNFSKKINLLGSYTDFVIHYKTNEIRKSIGDNCAYKAKVMKLIYGGYLVDIDGVVAFLAGSQASMNKIKDFNELLGKEIYVVPISYDTQRDCVIVSHKEYLKKLVPEKAQDLKMGQELMGMVTGVSKFGVFVEFNEILTGLIHKTELVDDLERFQNGEIQFGDLIRFRIKDIVNPFRIICTQNEVAVKENPYVAMKKKLQVPCLVKGVVKEITRFGVFIEIEEFGVSGLLHKSEFSENSKFEINQKVEVVLYKIEAESRKIYFKLKK